MTYASPPASVCINQIRQWPMNCRELMDCQTTLELSAGLHFGLRSRLPDHIACCIGGMVRAIDLLDYYDPKRMDAARNYYRCIWNNNPFLSYAIITPQADQLRLIDLQADASQLLDVVDKDIGNITMRGAAISGKAAAARHSIISATAARGLLLHRTAATRIISAATATARGLLLHRTAVTTGIVGATATAASRVLFLRSRLNLRRLRRRCSLSHHGSGNK